MTVVSVKLEASGWCGKRGQTGLRIYLDPGPFF